MNGRNQVRRRLPANTILIGAVILLTGAVLLAITYNANRGLPFVPTYDIEAEVPDAAELVGGGSEVRLGGARIGLVSKVTAETRGGRTIARLGLQLDRGRHVPLPADTTIEIRPRSILGAKYVDITPGRSARKLKPGQVLPLRNARTNVEFDEALEVFGPKTARHLRGVLTGLGDGVAGRGSDINRTVAATADALPPAERVLRALGAPETNLGELVRAVPRVMEPLAAEGPALGGALRGAAGTVAALDRAGGALAATVAELPATEDAMTRSFRRLRPLLAETRALTRGLDPGIRALPRTARELSITLDRGRGTLRATPAFADGLGVVLGRLRRVAAKPTTTGALHQLQDAIDAVRTLLGPLEPAQLHCNVGGIFMRNLGDAVASQSSLGHTLNSGFIFSVKQLLAPSTGDPGLNANPTPIQNADECESGHEPYERGKRLIGNPDGRQGHGAAAQTGPPAEATARAERAGLLRSAVQEATR